MSTHSRHALRTLSAAIAAGLLLVSGVSVNPALADDAPPSGFPSWADVQQAKGNAAATQTEIGKINGLLDSLSAESDVLGTAAVQAGASYSTTKTALDAASAKVGVLQAQSRLAATEAAKYKKEVTAAAVQSYKSGGTGLGIFDAISSLDSPDALQGLDMLHQLGGQAATQQTRAKDAQSVAHALATAEQQAEAARAELAAAAKTAMDNAVAAQQAVVAQLAAKHKQSTTLTAQLASLNNTTAAVEQKYRQGQEALAAYAAAQEAKRQAAAAAQARAAAAEAARVQAEQQAAANAGVPAAPQPAAPAIPDPGGGFIPVEVLLPNIPGGEVNDPSGAQAYAASRLGAHGWAQSQFQCLFQLWTQESSWLTNATNSSSGAYGIAQALPPGKYAETGGDWLTNYRTQIDWGLNYIGNRYGSPCGAWAHEVSNNWY
ncbi:MAG: lytic transglycosylase domain-containing protein [Specibacter sp.]